MRPMKPLKEAVVFDCPLSTTNDFGVTEDGWDEHYCCRAELIYMRGDEAVEASRLGGKAVYKVRIRQSEKAREITPAFRMRDERRGTVYNVREADSITDRLWVWLIVQSGVSV